MMDETSSNITREVNKGMRAPTRNFLARALKVADTASLQQFLQGLPDTWRSETEQLLALPVKRALPSLRTSVNPAVAQLAVAGEPTDTQWNVFLANFSERTGQSFTTPYMLTRSKALPLVLGLAASLLGVGAVVILLHERSPQLDARVRTGVPSR